MARPLRVWIDGSDRTFVVVCDLCRGTWIYLSRPAAEEAARQHRTRELAADRAQCSTPNCISPAVVRSLCRGHYDSTRYAEKRVGNE